MPIPPQCLKSLFYHAKSSRFKFIIEKGEGRGDIINNFIIIEEGDGNIIINCGGDGDIINGEGGDIIIIEEGDGDIKAGHTTKRDCRRSAD